MINLADPIISVVSIFFPEREPTLTQEPRLKEYSREIMQALLAENEALIKACAETRESLASAYYHPEVTIPEEFPSTGFLVKRAVAERRASTSFQKFFTE